MGNIPRAFYELKFELDFIKLKGDSFQGFFNTIMEKRFPGDFVRVRPWGNVGDRKNDGYLTSKKNLYQVYAPNELSLKETLKKIDEDFEGTKPYWQQYLKIWTFVHNSRQGIAPDILKKLLELDEANSDITVNQWGYEELRNEFFKLDYEEISSILGPAPNDKSITKVRFKDLKIVLEAISIKQAIPDLEILPVPKEKIKYNKLSESVEILIKAGMRKSKLVGELFEKWTDPELGDRVASKFKEMYSKLKSLNLEPDMVFAELLEFAEQSGNQSPEHRAAALAVISYLFENCDIFEGQDDTPN